MKPGSQLRLKRRLTCSSSLSLCEDPLPSSADNMMLHYQLGRAGNSHGAPKNHLTLIEHRENRGPGDIIPAQEPCLVSGYFHIIYPPARCVLVLIVHIHHAWAVSVGAQKRKWSRAPGQVNLVMCIAHYQAVSVLSFNPQSLRLCSFIHCDGARGRQKVCSGDVFAKCSEPPPCRHRRLLYQRQKLKEKTNSPVWPITVLLVPMWTWLTSGLIFREGVVIVARSGAMVATCKSFIAINSPASKDWGSVGVGLQGGAASIFLLDNAAAFCLSLLCSHDCCTVSFKWMREAFLGITW